MKHCGRMTFLATLLLLTTGLSGCTVPGTHLFNMVDRFERDAIAINKAGAKLRALEKQLRFKK